MDKTFIKDWDMWKCTKCGALGNTDAEMCPHCKPMKTVTLVELAAILKELWKEKFSQEDCFDEGFNAAIESQNKKIEAIAERYGVEVSK